MKKTHKILTAVTAITLIAGCVLVPQVKAGAFEQKAGQTRQPEQAAEIAKEDLSENEVPEYALENEVPEYVTKNEMPDYATENEVPDDISENEPEPDDADIYDYENAKPTVPSLTENERGAYMAFLEQYEGNGEEAYSRVAGQYGSREEIHYFSILDLNQDGVNDLLTYEIINMRYEKIRAYTLDEQNKVVPFLFEDGREVLFDNDHQANGAYGFYVCADGHIHNCYSGGYGSDERIYQVEGNTIRLYLTHEENYENNTNTYTELGSEIAKSKYDSLTEKCGEDQLFWILNTAEGRESVGNK